MDRAAHKERPVDDRAGLPQSINMYLNLVSELSLTGVDAFTKDPSQMAKGVTPARRRRQERRTDAGPCRCHHHEDGWTRGDE
jgi:hypothetical protein